MRLICLLLLCALFAGGCGKPKGTVLGRAPEGKPVSILSARAGTTALKVVLDGVMVEKCPTAGCWFRLQDGSGIVKVDTTSAGFVVVGVPIETRLTVAGNVIAVGDDIQIEATGIRF